MAKYTCGITHFKLDISNADVQYEESASRDSRKPVSALWQVDDLYRCTLPLALWQLESTPAPPAGHFPLQGQNVFGGHQNIFFLFFILLWKNPKNLPE